jgi:hypothetical protein
MGLDINGVKLLLHARQFDVNFKRVITIGRQMLYVKQHDLKRMCMQAGLSEVSDEEGLRPGNYAEFLLKLLGAEITDSLDASDYEQASIIHDLNQPLPAELHSKYSLVIDGGSLEHVFNFPVAVKNCMDLLEEKGCYIGITPANNFLGHGFYQFSPELYFRVFSPDNGFRVLRMYLYADRKKNASFYEVRDPLELRQRVIMANASPSYLFVLARKTEKKEVFEITPQQSDYEHMVWTGEAGETVAKEKRRVFILTKVYRLWTDLWRRKFRPMGNSNPQSVRKIKLDLSDKQGS